MDRNCSENGKIIKLFGFEITTTTMTTSSDAAIISEKDFMGRKIKKGNRWTEDEQRAFLKGLDFHGKGSWTNIAKDFVPTRTSTQVASHAQKYFLRLLDANSNERKKRKKSSVFDLRIEKTEHLEKKTEDTTHQAIVPLGNNQESVQESHNVPSFVPNSMMKSVPTVMPLTWVHMYPYNDHYASTSISTTTFDKPLSGISSSSSSSSSSDNNLELKL
ncbi:probable transcription factor At5g61620 [Solanum stenotomum]|uniref:probable transcription factor At5g61620 n=1 Tax=Solanum stenotomum TaxID=172797 RepID=UPI0020D071DC|nr:probable transcription factor At5g61620 [Solanum stenotomum]